MIKLKHFIKLSIINLIIDSKSNIKNILIISCSFILFILTFSISGSLNKFINNYILNTIEHSSILIDYNENNFNDIYKTLKSNDKILEFYEYQTPIGGDIKNYDKFTNINKSDMLLLKSGFNSRTPYILSGRMFTENEEKVGIIPKKFDPTGEIGVNFEKEPKEYLDGEQFLGKTITLEFKSIEDKVIYYTFKVVGIYDAVNNMDYPSDIYIPYQDHKYLREQMYLTSQDNMYEVQPAKIIVALVDKQENVDTVLDELKNNNIYAYKKAEVSFLETVSNLIVRIGLIISIIVFIVSIINVSLNSISSIRKRQHEIGMLKVFGYKNIDIKIIIFLEILIINITSILISTIICKIIFMIIDIILQNNFSIYMSSFNIDINLKSILVSIIITVISILVLSIKNVRYITNINPIDAIKNKI